MTRVVLAQPLKCQRCGHTWRPRKAEVFTCPRCQSPKWDVKEEKR